MNLIISNIDAPNLSKPSFHLSIRAFSRSFHKKREKQQSFSARDLIKAFHLLEFKFFDETSSDSDKKPITDDLHFNSDDHS